MMNNRRERFRCETYRLLPHASDLQLALYKETTCRPCARLVAEEAGRHECTRRCQPGCPATSTRCGYISRESPICSFAFAQADKIPGSQSDVHDCAAGRGGPVCAKTACDCSVRLPFPCIPTLRIHMTQAESVVVEGL